MCLPWRRLEGRLRASAKFVKLVLFSCYTNEYRDVRLGRCDVLFGSLLVRVEFLLLAAPTGKSTQNINFEGCGGSNPPGSIVGAQFGVPLESVPPAILRIGHNNEAWDCLKFEISLESQNEKSQPTT
ncbi:hypothetical protein Ancab_017520 [Ancistrocladus abbreviatus]